MNKLARQIQKAAEFYLILFFILIPAISGSAWGEESAQTEGSLSYSGVALVPVAPMEKSPDYYDALADQAVQKLDWISACGIYDEALLKFPGHSRLLNNAAAVRDAWARAALTKNQWETALEACENALERGLMPSHFTQKISYIVQKGANAFIAENNTVQLEAWLGHARVRFASLPSVQKIIPAMYAEALSGLPVTDYQFYTSQGLAYLQSYQNLQNADHADAALVKAWCNRLLSEYQKQKAWEGALALLQTARELLPQDRELKKSEVFFWDARAKEYIQNQQWGFATLVYEQALDRFPADPFLTANLKYCRWKKNETQTSVQ